MDAIGEFLDKSKNEKLSIHVVGDCMLDEYYRTRVTRVSPESPNVCVMVSPSDKPSQILPGGAANVCFQLKSFNVSSRLFGFMDDDALNAYFAVGLLDTEHVTPGASLISRKRRYFDGDVEVGNRWDIESSFDDLSLLQDLLQRRIREYRDEPDVIVLSDYDKGVFVDRTYDLPSVPTIVDPKRHPLSKWRGCTIFKPNSVEAYELSGLKNWREQCEFFLKELSCQSVVITRQGEGVFGLDREGGWHEYAPSRKVLAKNPIGAGDCFIAALAMAIGHKFTIDKAARIAFEAGAVYVERGSRGSVTPWMLRHRSKFISPSELRERDFKLVFTNGCFDILHTGHLESLRIAKSKGDKLVVAVNSDESVRRLKGPSRPVNSLRERMEMLSALEFVDFVVSFEDDLPQSLIEAIRPDVLIKGADWIGRHVAGTDVVKEVHYVPLVHDKSTTSLIEKIKSLI